MAGITHDYLDTSGYKPTALEAGVGELIPNLADGTLWSKNVGGTVIEIGSSVATASTVDNQDAETAGQTVFTTTYNIDALEVFQDGMKLSPGQYTATNGTSVVLDEGVALNTWLNFRSNTETPGATVTWGSVTNTPTTLAGYGITDAIGSTGANTITTLGTIILGTWEGTDIADAYIASATTWNAKQDALTFGIADNNAVEIDSATVATGEYAKFTANGLESKTTAELKTDLSLTASDVSLGNVVNSDTTNADNISDGSTNAIITLTQETNFESAYTHSGSSHAPVDADNTATNETSHGNITLGTNTLTNTATDTDLTITGNGTGVANIDGNAATADTATTATTADTATTATSVSDSSVAQDTSFDATAGFIKSDGDGTYSVDTSTYLTSETSHGNITLGTNTITNSAVDTDLGITGNGTGVANIDGNAATATSYTVTSGDVTAHQAALSITESQISDFGTYLTSETSHGTITLGTDTITNTSLDTNLTISANGTGTVQINDALHTTGNITTDGTVDGVDIATRDGNLTTAETKLGYIENLTGGTTDQVLTWQSSTSATWEDAPEGGITTGKAIAMAMVFG